MRYVNNVSKRALELYVDSEHVDVSSELLIEVVEQIQKNVNAEENLSEVDVAEYAVAGLMQIIIRYIRFKNLIKEEECLVRQFLKSIHTSIFLKN